MQMIRTRFGLASLALRAFGLPALCAAAVLGSSGCAPKQGASMATPATAAAEPTTEVKPAEMTTSAPTTATATGSNPYTDRGAAATLESQIRAGAPSLLAHVEMSSGKKAIMRTVSHSLGVQCDYCHDVSDFGAASTGKTVADYMLTHFSNQLVNKDGSMLACNDCHQGQAKFLGDRGDRQRIKALMKTRYVEGLRLKDGGEVQCETCHGRPFVPEFLPKKG